MSVGAAKHSKTRNSGIQIQPCPLRDTPASVRKQVNVVYHFLNADPSGRAV